MSTLIRTFTRLPSADQRLLVKTALLLIAIIVGLRVLPFRVLQRFIVRVTVVPKVADITDNHSVDRVVWAVKTTSRYVPRASCLVQAMVSKILLARRGHLTQLCIGVTRDEKRTFQAHAWLEHEGAVIFGESDIDYTPLPPLDGEP
jgi:hypothetical protein